MAKIVKIKSELKAEKRKLFFTAVVYLLLSLLSFGLAMYMLIYQKEVPVGVGAGVMAAGALFFVFYSLKRRKYMIVRSGVSGENGVLNILRQLPDGYTVIANPVIDNRGKYNELDFVIASDDALFIIETKNYRGAICGKASEKEITQTKLGKGGTPYDKTVKNPVFQADMQGRRMRELLTDTGFDFTVFPILYFTDSTLKINIEKDKPYDCKIIKDEDTLINYIIKTHGNVKIKNSDVKTLVSVLKRP